jgi:hypothetical protein
MPISNCTVRLAKIKEEKEFYGEGHVQIWKELTEEEYMVSRAAQFGLPDLELPANSARENLHSTHRARKN